MATNTYVALKTTTLSSATATVVIDNIPQGYTDLVLVCDGTAATTTIYPGIQFNGITTTTYSRTYLRGSGTTATSGRDPNADRITLADWYTTQRNNIIIQISNYSNSTTFKTILTRSNTPSSGVEAAVGLWRNTPAITSISILAGSNFSIGSTFSVYGIAADSVGAKATGGIISSDANYFYHTFAASGTFTPTQSLTADYLVVAGGGGGGSNTGTNGTGAGGGGAGGFRSTVTATGGGGSLESPLSLSATNYTVTIGAGGAGSTSSTVRGTNGGSSVFSTVTSIGGGGGGSTSSPETAGATGGSGGGAGATTGTPGSRTSNQGFAGGATGGSQGGGGGGASAVGGTAVFPLAGNGGNGQTTSISGFSNTYAGGGGGGSRTSDANRAYGGTGGGGNGGYVSGAAANAIANTGSGGGGAGTTTYVNGGAGGSGIVIVRYAK